MDYSKIRKVKRFIKKDRVINDPTFLPLVLEDMLSGLQTGLYFAITDMVHIRLYIEPFLKDHHDTIYHRLRTLCECSFRPATSLINVFVKEDFLYPDPRMDEDHCILYMTMEVKVNSRMPIKYKASEWFGEPKIKKVIFNPPATIVYWRDGSKTVSKVQDGDTWDSEKGLAMAIIKKTMGLKEFYKHFDEHAVNANFWHHAFDIGYKEGYKTGKEEPKITQDTVTLKLRDINGDWHELKVPVKEKTCQHDECIHPYADLE